MRIRIVRTLIGTAVVAAAALAAGSGAAASAGTSAGTTAGTPARTSSIQRASTTGTLTGPTPQAYAPFDSPAGDPCPFALHSVFPVNHVVAFTHTDAAGRITAVHYTGKLTMRVTRVDTGRSVLIDISGDGVQVFAKDGSSIFYAVGPFSSTQHPGDHPGPELALLQGASALAIAADGHKRILYASRVVDVCRKLA